MKYRDPKTGEIKSISVKASDTLPIGSVVDFEGTEIPEGWEQIIDNCAKYTEKDLNDVKGGIIFGYAHRCTNRPGSGENGNVFFFPHTDYPDTYGNQIYISRPSGHIHCRTLENGVWSKWVSITNDYSTTEEIIGKWIDGKPIYRKVIKGTTPSTANSDVVAIELSKIAAVGEIDTVTKLDGMLTEQSARFPINAYYNTSYYIATYWHPEQGIRMQVGSNLTARGFTLVIEYTKTTD